MGKQKSQNINGENVSEISYKKKHKKGHKTETVCESVPDNEDSLNCIKGNNDMLGKDSDLLMQKYIPLTLSCKKRKKRKHHQYNEVDGDDSGVNHGKTFEKEMSSIGMNTTEKAKTPDNDMLTNIGADSTIPSDASTLSCKKKRKKKHRQDNEVDRDTTGSNQETIFEKENSSIGMNKIQKAKVSDNYMLVNKEVDSTIRGDVTSTSSCKKNNKKKHRHDRGDGNHEKTFENENVNNKLGKYEEIEMGNEHNVVSDKGKSKSKKKRHTRKYDVCDTTSEKTDYVEKKKHKRKHADCEESRDVVSEIVQKEESAQVDGDKPSKKKKKKHKKERLPESMAGDGEDISIADTLSQGEPKKEYISDFGKSKDATDSCMAASKGQHNVQVPAVAGQWHTASFENDARQNKFLRLLGAFKQDTKNNNDVMKNRFEFVKGKRDVSLTGNVAMTTKEENTYKKSMANEYEKAMGFNKQRGIGFGFEKPAAEGKKFHIDVHTSNSVKFDD